MGLPVVTVASGGLPIVESTVGGTPVTEASNGYGVPVTKVVGKPGLPVVFETIGVSGGGGTTYATWDAATVTNVALSGGNLVATNTLASVSGDQGARVVAAAGKASGKYYFEATLTTFLGGGNVGIGVGLTSATYTGMGANAAGGGEEFFGSGGIYASGVGTAFTLGVRATGNVIGVAVDIGNRKAWFRVASSGLWNGNGGHDAAAGTGGVTIPAGTHIPIATFGGAGGFANNVLTTNFGASAFVGAVPAGFTPGWPA